jgi:hypothetical protein
MKSGNVLSIWGKVFRDWKYLIPGVIIAVLFYLFNVFVQNWRAVVSFSESLGFIGSFKFFWNLATGFNSTVETHSFVSLVIISLMFGMLFSLIYYKAGKNVSHSSKKVGVLGGIGIALGILVPGCAACGIGLVSALGLSAAILAFLPFKGLELSIFAIAILGISIIKISKDLTMCNSCQIDIEPTTVSKRKSSQSDVYNKHLKGGKKYGRK